ncbi:MAG: peptidoglycan DD-metalloendopeptidase family protein, partial [Actinomycetota bacterium]|nr:peptidoglycan DD-metalloendopeptidase family protein [Actinomycetota bacterium]
MAATAFLLAVSAVPALTGVASSDESIADLEARMASIQADLDETTTDVENLHAEEERLETDIAALESRIAAIEKRQKKLRVEVAERADELYRLGGTGMVEILFGSEDLGQLQDRAEILSRVSLGDTDAFVAMARSQAELERLTAQKDERQERLDAAAEELQAQADRLQAQFDSAAAEMQRLQDLLEARVGPVAAAAPVGAPSVPSTNGKACPVGQPRSFVDSWGYPRSGGRTHEGTDIMSSYGTPVYAIVSGSITYAGYGGSAGNWQILSGSDGNTYWY